MTYHFDCVIIVFFRGKLTYHFDSVIIVFFRGKLSPADVQESVVSGARSLWIVIQYSAIKVGSLIRNTTAELLW